ncbi:MAG TPA: VCBS repeat-containing protein [Anaeromyxobacter sp.]|nr:VCBS repeat-containing protein [Anaeromyxobacter sp.]
MRLAVLLAAAAAGALAAAPSRAAPPPAAVAAAGALAREVGAPPEGRRPLRLAVEAEAPALARIVESALEAALSAEGYAVTPHRGPGDAEAAARAAGQDWLLRVRAGLVPGGAEVALVGELVPAWPSFFLQRRPEARAIPPRVVQARAPADAETRLLAREERRAGAPFAAVRTIGRLAGRVLALAIGDADGRGRPAVVAVTADAVLVLGPEAVPVAVRRAVPGQAAPVRDPAAALAVGDFGGGRIAVQRAGEPRAEVLAVRGGALEPAGALGAAPLCAGGAGPLFGGFAPGTGVFLDLLSPLVDPAARPRSARLLYGAAAAPGGGPLAYAVLGVDLGLALLGPDLAPVRGAAAADALATGSGFALADLDGDGTAELVASSPAPGAPDRIRVLAPLSRTPLLLESAAVDGAILAAAGGDLTGDGVDDAVVAAIAAGADGAPASTLLLVSADPRELR